VRFQRQFDCPFFFIKVSSQQSLHFPRTFSTHHGEFLSPATNEFVRTCSQGPWTFFFSPFPFRFRSSTLSYAVFCPREIRVRLPPGWVGEPGCPLFLPLGLFSFLSFELSTDSWTRFLPPPSTLLRSLRGFPPGLFSDARSLFQMNVTGPDFFFLISRLKCTLHVFGVFPPFFTC